MRAISQTKPAILIPKDDSRQKGELGVKVKMGVGENGGYVVGGGRVRDEGGEKGGGSNGR